MLAFLGGEVSATAQAQERTAEDTYRYNPEGKRDPFFSPLLRVSQEEEAPEGARTPLQRVDIGQLKLVGVILEEGEPRALIEDNVGLGYIVTRGTFIGSKGGTIKVIEPKRIVVEEYETDFYGRRQAHERELQLVVAESTPKGEENRAK
jgi:type IV pilus assembly protein PilP